MSAHTRRQSTKGPAHIGRLRAKPDPTCRHRAQHDRKLRTRRTTDFSRIAPDDEQKFAVRKKSPRPGHERPECQSEWKKNDSVWRVIHSRPDPRNAMDPGSAVALYEAFRAFDTDEAAQVAVFRGEGGVFCSGWDLKHAAALSGADALDSCDFPDEGEPPMAAMGSKPAGTLQTGDHRRCPCCGGWRPGIRPAGRYPGDGGDRLHGRLLPSLGHSADRRRRVRLPRLVSEGHAMDLILSGCRVDAEEALHIGLCEYIVPEGETRTKAESLAHDICRFFRMAACEPTAVRPARSTV